MKVSTEGSHTLHVESLLLTPYCQCGTCIITQISIHYIESSDFFRFHPMLALVQPHVPLGSSWYVSVSDFPCLGDLHGFVRQAGFERLSLSCGVFVFLMSRLRYDDPCKKPLCGHVSSYLLSKYPGVELPGHGVGICLVLQKTARTCSKAVVPSAKYALSPCILTHI